MALFVSVGIDTRSAVGTIRRFLMPDLRRSTYLYQRKSIPYFLAL